MNILVVGGFDPNDSRLADIERFGSAVGEEIAVQGHVLLSGCQTHFDGIVAQAAHSKLQQIGDSSPDKRVVSYLLIGKSPIHNYGKIIQSRLTDWEIGNESFYVPETISQSDAVIFIGGFEGTFRAANWARVARKPLLPVTAFGGAAAKVYEHEFNNFEANYASHVDAIDYQELNSVTSDWQSLAKNIVSLAEKIATSKSVAVIMSYSGRDDLEDAYDSFQDVCKEFGYECERVEDSNTTDRIVPKIMEKIRHSAFVIADLSELKTNVFYELGYAEGFSKPVVVTAKKGTELPFDVKDVPTIFWDGQRGLKDSLRTKIKLIAQKQGRTIS